MFVAPSQIEPFGKTLVEAMSCGTPVVCFDATGPKDIVMQKVTGYKAKPFDPADLARGIEWVLDLPEAEHQHLKRNARSRAIDCFDSTVIARRYLKLYKRVLAQ